MPFMVKGEDGREIAENLADADAHTIAVSVSQETGEAVTLVPYVFDVKAQAYVAYVLDEDNATIVQAHHEPTSEDADGDEDVAATDGSLESMTGAQLDDYAAKHKIEGYKKSSTVGERRAFIASALPQITAAA